MSSKTKSINYSDSIHKNGKTSLNNVTTTESSVKPQKNINPKNFKNNNTNLSDVDSPDSINKRSYKNNHASAKIGVNFVSMKTVELKSSDY